MIQKITIEQFINLAERFPVLDVRSPGEFNQGHIPQAYNLPLFTDEERKIVGTAYKQQSKEVAIKIGLDYFGVKMRKMVEEVEVICNNQYAAANGEENNIAANKPPSEKSILVHCWRGGMRSAGIAWMLNLYGFKVYTLNGGYKIYRRWVKSQFEKTYNFTLLGGYTGSGKTMVLHELKKLGRPVIDLEGLGKHKGSAFGSFGEGPQPSQEMFENLLAVELVAMSRLTEQDNPSTGASIYIEDESQRIGLLNIPNDLWKTMRKSYSVFIDIPFEERLNYLTIEYGKFEKQLFIDAIPRIQKRLGGLESKTAIEHLLQNNYKECFRILLRYYDKCYARALGKSEANDHKINKMNCADVDVAIITNTLISKRRLFNAILAFLLCFLPAHLFCQAPSAVQPDITGIWKGSLYNDTTKKYLPYQVAISEEGGKIMGYSYTLFDIDGKEEWGIKKLKIKRENDQLTLEDVALIANDYSEPPPKKVRVLSIVRLTTKDSLLQMAGSWSTNQTREYSALTGTLQLQHIIDYKTLVLFVKLTALKLQNDLSFVKEDNKRIEEIAIKGTAIEEIASSAPVPQLHVVATALPEKIAVAPAVAQRSNPALPQPGTGLNASRTSSVTMIRLIDSAAITIAKAPVPSSKSASKKDSLLLSTSIVKNTRASPPLITPGNRAGVVAVNDSIKIRNKIPYEVAGVIAKPKTDSAPAYNETAKIVKVPSGQSKPALPITTTVPFKNQVPIIPANEKIKNPAPSNTAIAAGSSKAIPSTESWVPGNKTASAPTSPILDKSIVVNNISAPVPIKKEMPPVLVDAASEVSKRKNKEEQSVFFESDSLVLTLYDNGEVDGDTVSVLMNGKIIFARQGLSTVANSKTIYFDNNMPDSISMIMYAENLGSIPPNTGLMIIMDGEKRYEVRFSADLSTNASIVFRRKLKLK
ncbi:MAG: tRNA 2-selenouridine(34) synthase MnmH [Ferruginibacter sp.]